MFHNPLVELVEDVGGNSKVDIRVGKVLPEGMDNGFYAGFGTGGAIAGRIVFESGQRFQDSSKVSELVVFFKLS